MRTHELCIPDQILSEYHRGSYLVVYAPSATQHPFEEGAFGFEADHSTTILNNSRYHSRRHNDDMCFQTKLLIKHTKHSR